jgi:acyl-CoA thioester hydrolase
MITVSHGTVLTSVTLRYSDMDALGHLNNAVYATLFEAGRVAYVEQKLAAMTPPGAGYVIVKLIIDFRAEARYPGTAEVATAITRLGGSSMTFAQEIQIAGRRVASAECICALFDLTRRKALRLPDAMRAGITIEPLSASGSANPTIGSAAPGGFVGICLQAALTSCCGAI